MKILIVDDEQSITEILSTALNAYGGYTITVCNSAARAIEIIETAREPFDLFLLDIQMPEMTGIELCADIRHRRQYRHTPILMLTAMTDKPHIDSAFASGATDYITKPFDFSDLKHRMKLAEKSSFQAMRLSQDALVLRDSIDPVGVKNPYDIAEEVPIDDVNGFLRSYVFENYLLQMGRLEYHRTSLALIFVTNIEEVYLCCAGKDFFNGINLIARAISNALTGTGAHAAYFGRGVYAVAIDNHRLTNVGNLMMSIQDEHYRVLHSENLECTKAPEFLVRLVKKPSLFTRTGPSDFIDTLMRELRTGNLSAALSSHQA